LRDGNRIGNREGRLQNAFDADENFVQGNNTADFATLVIVNRTGLGSKGGNILA
jgi:hypothetical protein